MRLRSYPGMGVLIDEFYRSIRQDRPSPVDGEAGREVVRVLDMVYGPGGKNSLVQVGVRKGRLNVIFGDGQNVLPLVYVENVVDALVLAARREEAIGRAYNVVDDDRVTQRDFLARMGPALGARQSTVYLPLPTVRLLASAADAAKAALRGGRRSPHGMFSRITRSLQTVRYDTSRAKAELG